MAKPPIKSLDEVKKEFLDSIPEEMKVKFDEIEQLRKENYELKKTLEVYGITEITPITDVEYICLQSIEHFKRLANTIGLSPDDVKSLDTIHKNLRMARGKMEKKDIPDKEESIDDLMRIINGGKS
jgi:hypothetical protein